MTRTPPRRSSAAPLQHGQTLGRGADFALVILVFSGLGLLLDRWAGTMPWFTIGLVVFSFVGQFIKLYYDYTATMERLEEERRQASAARRVTTETGA